MNRDERRRKLYDHNPEIISIFHRAHATQETKFVTPAGKVTVCGDDVLQILHEAIQQCGRREAA